MSTKSRINLLSLSLAGLFLIFAFGSSDSSDSSDSSSTEGEKSSDPAATADAAGGDESSDEVADSGSEESGGESEDTEPAKPAGPELGTAKSIDSFEVTLNSTSEKRSTKDSFMDHTAGEGAILRLVNVKIKNIGKEQEMLLDNFKVVSGEMEFGTSTECTMATPKALSWDQINPGLSKTGNVCFEIPADATGLKLVFEASMWGSKKMTFSLDK